MDTIAPGLRRKDSWSWYFQNPELMHAARIEMLNPENLALVKKWLDGPPAGSKILDVGCGSGEFTFYLAKAASGCSFTGADIDPGFIDAAVRDSRREDSRNTINFCQADGLNLPFEDGTFDLVVSHTYLTSVPSAKAALDEMIRVTRPGGKTVSVTADSYDPPFPGSTGHWPKRELLFVRLASLGHKVMEMYQKITPPSVFVAGTAPKDIPFLFASSSLKKVEMHSLGNCFSLSDAALDPFVKEDYIQSQYKGEKLRFERYMELPEAGKLIPEAEALEYLELLKYKRDFLLSHPEDNNIWEWSGGSSIWMIGRK